MPRTMFRLRLCDVSCKLSFGVRRLLMIALALGKEFAITDPEALPLQAHPEAAKVPFPHLVILI